MFKIYEVAPRYCKVTDALMGARYGHVATVATKGDARAYAADWYATSDGEVSLSLRDGTGAEVSWDDDAAPVGNAAPAADDDWAF